MQKPPLAVITAGLMTACAVSGSVTVADGGTFTARALPDSSTVFPSYLGID